MAAEIINLNTRTRKNWSDNQLLMILCSLKAKQIIAHRENCHVMQNKFLVEYVVSDEGDEGLLVSLVLQAFGSRWYNLHTQEQSTEQTTTVPHAIWERQNNVNYVKWCQPSESYNSGRCVKNILEERHHQRPILITYEVMEHHASYRKAIAAELRSTGTLLLNTVDEKDNNLWDSSFLSEIAEPKRVVDYGC